MTVEIGAFMLNQQFSSGATQDAFAAPNPYIPSPYDISNAQSVIAGFAQRLSNLERAIQLQVSADTVISQILLTKDAALISSDKIGIVGEVTFADWHRTISGQIAGGIDPSITQIIGGVIKTGKVQSFDGLSWIDLDAQTTTPFLKCQSAVSVLANGNFTFGATVGAQLTWDGSNLSLGGNSLLAGTYTSTVVSNASSALSGLSGKLNNSASDILGGNITFNSAGAFQIGTATWNGTTAGGTGIMYNQYGIVAVNAGTVEFSLNGSTGAAIFAGTLSAASGTFAGDVTTSGHLYATGGYSFGGYQGAVIGAPSSGSGVLGYAPTGTAGTGVTGVNGIAGGVAVEAFSPGIGTALLVTGAISISGQTVGTGSATATYAGTNKPGSSSSNTWLTLSINGALYDLAVWPH